MPVTINDHTRIIDLTVGQAEDLFRGWVRSEVESAKAGAAAANAQSNRHVYGLKGLAKIIGCSTTRACQINTSGIIDAARTRVGNLMIFDSEQVLELLKQKEERESAKRRN